MSGQFDQATYDAVRSVQEERNLYVDGVVGRETALSLEIWPDEESFVTRTPPPPEGAVDAWGYPLSSVASTGAGAPPLPANSGSGRRVVYERAGQRVWAVDKDENIIRSWLVSGSQYTNEVPGTHQVYSKSEVSTAWNGKAFLPLMVRWYKTDIGNLGFHAIPIHRSDNTPYQTEAELGTRLSGGCQRQAESRRPVHVGLRRHRHHRRRPVTPPPGPPVAGSVMRAQSNSCICRADGGHVRRELLYLPRPRSARAVRTVRICRADVVRSSDELLDVASARPRRGQRVAAGGWKRSARAWVRRSSTIAINVRAIATSNPWPISLRVNVSMMR